MLLCSHKHIFPPAVAFAKQPPRFPISQSERTQRSKDVKTTALHCSGKVKEKRDGTSRRRGVPGHSIPSSQSIHCRPTVILFVQINNEKAAAAHGGAQRVVIAAFQTGSDGLGGRLAQLHCDLVCVCNFPQALEDMHRARARRGCTGIPAPRESAKAI